MNNLDDILIKLEYILEEDPRTFSNPISNNDFYFDQIYEAYKIIKNLQSYKFKEENENI